MAKADFIEQLKGMGHEVRVDNERVTFNYEVPVGKFAGTMIELGFQVGDDYPLNAPGGPHLKPALLPLYPGADRPHPAGGVHVSPFGTDWQYWSRPYSNWNQTEKTASVYMAHIRRLFETQ